MAPIVIVVQRLILLILIQIHLDRPLGQATVQIPVGIGPSRCATAHMVGFIQGLLV